MTPNKKAEATRRWAWHRRALLALRDRLRAERSEHAGEAAEPMYTHDTRSEEGGNDEFDRDVALALLAAEENALVEVEAALARIEKGVYGICEETGREIPVERLRALPWCRTTVEAAKARESRRA